MSQRQAAETSVGEYLQRRNAYERQQQVEWERCRWMAWSIFSPFVNKNKPRTPSQWIKFPWEKEHIVAMVEIKPVHQKTLDSIFNDFHNRHN